MKKEEIINQLVALNIFKAAADADKLTVPQLTLLLKGANADAEAEKAKVAFEEELAKKNQQIENAAVEQAKLATEKDSLAGMVKERDNVIEGLTETLAKAEGKVAATDKTAPFGGKNYRMIVPKARFQGNIVSLEILRENPEVLGAMIKAKSPVIVEDKPEKP